MRPLLSCYRVAIACPPRGRCALPLDRAPVHPGPPKKVTLEGDLSTEDRQQKGDDRCEQ